MKKVFLLFLLALLKIESSYSQTSTWSSAVNPGGHKTGYSKSISADTHGNIYITGLLNDTTRFGNTTLTAGFFIAKYDANGTSLWAQCACTSTVRPPHRHAVRR